MRSYGICLSPPGLFHWPSPTGNLVNTPGRARTLGHRTECEKMANGTERAIKILSSSQFPLSPLASTTTLSFFSDEKLISLKYVTHTNSHLLLLASLGDIDSVIISPET